MDGTAIAYHGCRRLGLGLTVIGAGLGHRPAGRRRGRSDRPPAQRGGADHRRVNLPLFLLEGVAILAEVFALLIVL